MRSSRLALLAGVLTVALVSAGGLAAKDPKRDRNTAGTTIALPGDAVYPEGVTAAGRYVYTGSSSQGTIFRGPRKGGTAQILSPGGTDGRTAAIGMKVARNGNLVVAGGGTGKVFVLDRATGATRGVFSNAGAYTAGGPTFLNDVAIARNGDAYVTDSFAAVIYRIPAASLANPPALPATGQLEPWLLLEGSPITYQAGFNLNGIVAKKGLLLVVQANTGKLFRISIGTKRIVEVPVTGATLTGGDGMVLTGRELYVVHQGKIDVVKLTRRFTRAKLRRTITDPTFDSPTTAAIHRGRLYVVNSQFGRRNATPPVSPVLPFTVSVLRPGRHLKK